MYFTLYAVYPESTIMKCKSFLVTLVVTTLAVFAPQSFAATDLFLKIEGVQGESVDRAHADEIDVLAWSFGASQSGTRRAGGGGGAGKVRIQDLSLTKWIDSATPSLMRAVATGEHYKQATLTLRRAGTDDKQAEYFVITMEDVLVSSVSVGGSADEDRPTEEITLNFKKFELRYFPQQADGSAGSAIDFAFNIAENTVE
jgi:type VI secretion system secreted protein Hcp